MAQRIGVPICLRRAYNTASIDVYVNVHFSVIPYPYGNLYHH